MKSSFSKEEGSCLAWRENLLNSIEKLKLFWMKQLDKDAIFPLSLISIAIERRVKRCLLKRDRQSFSFSKLSYDRVKTTGRKEGRKEGGERKPSGIPLENAPFILPSSRLLRAIQGKFPGYQ